ncbi:hypothetical protein GF108_12600 [Phyllobacterium sp. SYP-B3895]|uniref:sigma factor-like helix-turn-helix DNA-binding protein n=1 Tax=Phyllobacterium sp. SYP-B3895 TaxID=2663240 RepID=UPI00129989FF|nr:sigma factor-like helix-turn-helix DNA-binding protein [Phyllobacterium sp. SYP-B3895]MRG56416.1 hypothetical protein [Phyllobacterium sp. SYP-B3895]
MAFHHHAQHLSHRLPKARPGDDGIYDGYCGLPRRTSCASRMEIRAQDVQAALHRLPTEQRIAIVLCCVLGHSYQEAAEICCCEIGTIKSRIGRGKLALLSLLGEESRLSVLETDYRSSTTAAINAFA